MRKESAIMTLDDPVDGADSGAGHGSSATQEMSARTTKSKRGPMTPVVPEMRAAQGEVGQEASDTHGPAADLATICHALKGLQVKRRHLIRSKDRNRLSLGSLVRRHLGWRADMPEAERKTIRGQADDLIDKAMQGNAIGDDAWITDFVLDCEAACTPFDKRLAIVEKEMIRLAKQLPATAWVESVRGFGIKTLAIIVGEAGDIGGYANPGKLWKRLGLAPKDTYAQADNGAYMVPRQRRAEMWACLGDSLLRGNRGGYKQAYDTKKAEYLERGWTKFHAHKAAHRYMEKRALRDLWRAWRGHPMFDIHSADAAPINSSYAKAKEDGSAKSRMDNQRVRADPTIPPSVAGAGQLLADTQAQGCQRISSPQGAAESQIGPANH